MGHSRHDFSFLPVRGNETGEGHNPAVGKQLRNLSDAADVLHAVFLGEAHVLVEPHADIITVETVLFTSNGQGIWIGNNEERAGAMGFGSCPLRVREKKKKHERALCSEMFLRGGGLKSWVDGGGGLRGSTAEEGMQRGRGGRERWGRGFTESTPRSMSFFSSTDDTVDLPLPLTAKRSRAQVSLQARKKEKRVSMRK